MGVAGAGAAAAGASAAGAAGAAGIGGGTDAGGSGLVSGAGVTVGGTAGAAGSSNEFGQDGIAWAGVAGSSSSDRGRHAGIARSVGGSGGQMSVSSAGAGADSAVGGQVDFLASAATAFNGSVSEASSASVSGASAGFSGTGRALAFGAGGALAFGAGGTVAFAGGAVASDSTPASSVSGIGSPGEVCTVCAHSGGLFGGLVFWPSPLTDVSVLDQSGSPFCIGRGGSASSSAIEEAVSPLFSAGSTGTVPAQTGVVSFVGTGVTGSSDSGSGGFEPCDSAGLVSKSNVSLTLRSAVLNADQAKTCFRASSGSGSGCCSAQSAASDASWSHAT